MGDTGIVSVALTFSGIIANPDVVTEDSFIPRVIIGYDQYNNPIYPDPTSTVPIGTVLPAAIIPDIPSIYLTRCACDVYTDSNGLSRLKDVTVSWNASTGADYYQVFFIEDGPTSLKYNVNGQDFGNYSDGPLFSYQSGPVTGTTFIYRTTSFPKRINALVFAYSRIGRSGFPLTMATFLATNKVGTIVNFIYVERTSYVYKPGFCFNFDDLTQDLGTASQNLSSYKDGVNVITAEYRPLSPEFYFNRCDALIQRDNIAEGDPSGWIANINFEWTPVENAISYQIFLTTGHNDLSGNISNITPEYDVTGALESYSHGPLFFYQSGLIDGSQTTFTYNGFMPNEILKCSAFIFAYNDAGRSDYPTHMLSVNSLIRPTSLGLISIERTRYLNDVSVLKYIDKDTTVDFRVNSANIVIRDLI
jgi:hypothetical protein